MCLGITRLTQVCTGATLECTGALWGCAGAIWHSWRTSAQGPLNTFCTLSSLDTTLLLVSVDLADFPGTCWLLKSCASRWRWARSWAQQVDVAFAGASFLRTCLRNTVRSGIIQEMKSITYHCIAQPPPCQEPPNSQGVKSHLLECQQKSFFQSILGRSGGWQPPRWQE